MKIRIQGNSIRYRLRQPEVESFKKFGSVVETIRLGMGSGDQLQFILRKSSHEEIAVEFVDTTTTVYVPESMAEKWTDSDLVGFDAIVEIGNGDGLKVLVEKDFKCLDRSDEDEVGAYENSGKVC